MWTYYGIVPLATSLNVSFSSDEELTPDQQMDRLMLVAEEGWDRLVLKSSDDVPHDGYVELADVQVLRKAVEGNFCHLDVYTAEIDESATENDDPEHEDEPAGADRRRG